MKVDSGFLIQDWWKYRVVGIHPIDDNTLTIVAGQCYLTMTHEEFISGMRQKEYEFNGKPIWERIERYTYGMDIFKPGWLSERLNKIQFIFINNGFDVKINNDLNGQIGFDYLSVRPIDRA